MATAKPFGDSLYFLAIAHSYGKVGTKLMLAAAYDYNRIVSASGLLSALFGRESCENARFPGFSGGFCPTFTDGVCIKDSVRIDFVIGNPPYQEEVENNGRSNPIYNHFMDASYKIADVVELITPARFLFNAGQTPKAWNKKMLEDEHFKVIHYEADASRIFPNTDIKGGVVITIRNEHQSYGAVNVFTAHEQLNSIIKKVSLLPKSDEYLDTILSSRGQSRFSDKFYEDYPEASSLGGSGTGNMIVSNIFDKLSDDFSEEPCDGDEIKILGRTNNQRIYKYIKEKYVQDNPYISTYNVCYPEATGIGRFGEASGTSVLSAPQCGATDTFINIGMFNSEKEAEALTLYLKTKFLRTLLGIKKVTQHNPKSVWQYVPLQDFTSASDIDWSKSIPEIDQQLYAKYGLDEKEIAFIESHVKEMS
ncbi:MAG: Eco57I restriction-modification methylase domain-containing protein [Clostridiales bacterium]|nr:Eco57I restriction-modification methylase domain-containing protein [Clostridiales bacterium]